MSFWKKVFYIAIGYAIFLGGTIGILLLTSIFGDWEP